MLNNTHDLRKAKRGLAITRIIICHTITYTSTQTSNIRGIFSIKAVR